MTEGELDEILAIQFGVAWAGEGDTRPARLGWWRTAFSDRDAGEDLLRRLAPRTWRWAILEAARIAARRVDDRARARAEDADHLVTIFRLGFEVDERLDDRLRVLKVAGAPPVEALPRLDALVGEWTPERFQEWLKGGSPARFSKTAAGRRLSGEVPASPMERVTRLSTALVPFSDAYPLPHFRVAR